MIQLKVLSITPLYIKTTMIIMLIMIIIKIIVMILIIITTTIISDTKTKIFRASYKVK